MKTISILGATGTIGQNCLQVIAANGGAFAIEAITANGNAKALADIARKTGAKFAAVADEASYTELKEYTQGLDIEVAAGNKAVVEAAARQSDVLVAGIVGAAGLKPTLAAAKRGAHIALANKECLVCAGELFMRTARDHGAAVIPVDSEHNAIFQILSSSQQRLGLTAPSDDVDSITLTASGGPFRECTLEQMVGITPEQAVKHPNWEMGAKISVDSATMVNKGLELIEAMHLFALPADKLKALVHPESIIHGLVSYRDGSVLAQLSEPDMRIPLAYAMGWPHEQGGRMDSGVAPINLANIGNLHFEEPDLNRFPAFAVAMDAMHEGDSAPTVLNAANEVAVQAFLEGHISFLDIASVIDETLQTMSAQPMPTIDEVMHIDKTARTLAKKTIANILLKQSA